MSLGRLLHLLGAALVVAMARGLLPLLAAFFVTALVKRLSSEARHLIWLGVIVSFLLIPLSWLALPALRVSLPVPLPPAAGHLLFAAPLLSFRDYSQVVDQTSIRMSLPGYLPPGLPGRASLALCAGWLAGVLALASRQVVGRLGLRRLASLAKGNDRLQNLALRLSRGFRIRRKISVLLSPGCTMPFTFREQRPVIVLPAGADRWPAQRARSVLIHELAHIRRRDALTQSAVYCLCLLFWFIPRLWLAYGALRREAECCCDQQVINRGIRGPEYARQIVDLARRSRGRLLLACFASRLGGKGLLRQRIGNLLRLAPGRKPFGVRSTLRLLAVMLCCLVPLLALAGQARPVALGPGDPLFGTWINEEYDKGQRYQRAKTVLLTDGRQLFYRHIDDAEPYRVGQGTFEAFWIGPGGERWYKFRWTSWEHPSGVCRKDGFGLGRVSAGGTVLEGVSAQYGYPPELSRLGPQYYVMHKEEGHEKLSRAAVPGYRAVSGDACPVAERSGSGGSAQ